MKRCNGKALAFRLMSILLLACFLCLPALAAGAEARTQQLYVTGKGGVTASPDIAYLSITASTKHDQAYLAQQENNQKLENITKELTALGIQKEDIITSSFTLSANTIRVNYDYVPDGYLSSCTLSITIRNLEQSGTAIDAAIRGGATKVNSIQFAVADPTPYYSQALVAAGKDAQNKAAALAGAFGVKLQAVLEIAEQTTSYTPVSYTPLTEEVMADAAPLANIEMPVQIGDINITATVRVTYLIG